MKLQLIRITALLAAAVILFTACEQEKAPDTETTAATTAATGESETTPTTPAATERPTPAPEKVVEFPGYEPTAHEMQDIPAKELVKQIRNGWNLGNTFDAPNETAWGNPETTFTMINAVKEAGFDSVRLPVSWGFHMGDAPEYAIEAEFMDRVEEVARYILAADMYCILNTHHEGWLFPTEEKFEENREQLIAVWEQIAERFADYNHKLLFEGMNEPRLHGTPDEWNGGTPDARQVVNRLNKVFVETVRSSGGNNPKRNLLITGYAASSERAAMVDIANAFDEITGGDDKISVSVHAYVPYTFALADKASPIFGSHLEIEIEWLFGNIQAVFLDKDIPVILGETGARIRDGNTEERVKWTKMFFGLAHEKGIPVYWWDNGLFVGREESELFGLFERNKAEFEFPEIVEAIMSE